MRQIVEVFFGKDEILVKLSQFSHFFIITYLKTDKYLSNFQEHLFGLLRLRKYQTSLQNFF